MRYLGGKARIAKPLTNFLKSIRKPDQIFVDGMTGGGSIIRNIGGQRIANDICPYLIAFYKQLQEGWLPPETLSEERYQELKQLYKNGECNGEIGFAAYFCSFGGKFWGGFARDKKSDRDFTNEAYEDSLRLIRGQYRDSIKLQEGIKDVSFFCGDYEDLLGSLFPGCLVYCDIPYIGTTEYKTKFDHERFYNIIRKLSGCHDIYISEYTMPNDFECVWSCERKTNLNMADGNKGDRTEKLFKFRGCI